MVGGQLTTEDITKKHWMPLEAVHRCVNPGCGVSLADSSSKYHCFSCGNIFCLKCASHFMPLDPGTAQFTSGGIPARVCSLCLEKGKETEAPAESLVGWPLSNTKLESSGGGKPVSPPFWQQQKKATSSSEVIVGEDPCPQMAFSHGELPEAPSKNAEEKSEPSVQSPPADGAVTPPESHVTAGDEERGKSGLRERGASTVGAVTLEGFSFKDGVSQDRPESRRPSIAAEPSKTTGSQIRGPSEKANPPLFTEAASAPLVSEGSAERGAVNSSRAAALDRAASKQGKKGKTRVVDLYDELLVGDTGSQAGRESEGGESDLQGGDAAGPAQGSKGGTGLPPTRASSLRAALSSEMSAGPPSSARLQRTSTQTSGSGRWLWGGLLGKAPKVDPQVLETKLSNMTSEIQALRGEVTTAEEQAVTVQAALDHLDGLLRSAALAEYLVIRMRWQSDTSNGLPSAGLDEGSFDGDWLQRFLVLEDDTLSYYFRATDPRPQGTIPLSQVVEAGPLTSAGPGGAEEAAVHGFYVATCHGLQLQCASANKFKCRTRTGLPRSRVCYTMLQSGALAHNDQRGDVPDQAERLIAMASSAQSIRGQQVDEQHWHERIFLFRL
ncbi:Pleckstrin homology (PH) domain-containing zinc finger protein [Klebsormidium nitens]|uniref:Pleckstrin homology (PH) domain-containing zinc finger protein n=1 Tax=Klebsormidium nitens TaxID=105231 RepID=A0A1Y1I7Q1_KLENI|nr:Pleckstrin homology (PH) domain-containing zinc finger protein [Klebsormidium nitens]|eukprot:GAQ85972.1 Pleckstrin homology (PH) domain-containing zinc finger protein [Klebsormidium nitens]